MRSMLQTYRKWNSYTGNTRRVPEKDLGLFQPKFTDSYLKPPSRKFCSHLVPIVRVCETAVSACKNLV